MSKDSIEKLIRSVDGYDEYYKVLKAKKEEWNDKIERLSEKIDEIVGPRVLVFPVSFENIFEIDIDDVKVKEFEDIDNFEEWLIKEGKNGKYLLVHSIYREFWLYIKTREYIVAINLEDLPYPDKVIKIS